MGLTPIVKDAEFILSALSFVRLTNALQDVFLTFVSVTMMYYFLPVGVILRTFSPTRRVGAFMMALSIGFYFVFPLTYIFNAAALERQHALIAADTAALTAFSENINLSALNFLDPTGLAAFVSELIAKTFWNAAVDALRSLTVLVADLTIQTTFFPLFNLGVVFLFSTSLYRMLKSEERWFVWN